MNELELQAKVINELQLNTPNPDIAAKFGISLVKVTRIKNKYEEAVRNNTVDKLLNLDSMVLDKATSLLKTELASLDDNIESVATDIKNSSALLAGLDEDLISTARIANNKLRVMISTADTAGELGMLIDSLATLRNSFFNKNVTTVAIQNNIGSAAQYDFASDLPGEVVQ